MRKENGQDVLMENFQKSENLMSDITAEHEESMTKMLDFKHNIQTPPYTCHPGRFFFLGGVWGGGGGGGYGGLLG